MHQKRRIVIIGGGTAGWMAANLLQHYLAPKGFNCTLIESPDIPTIGVGEGSTPQLKSFFSSLGLSESQWMPACHASYKNGIQFSNWSIKPKNHHYFHPFPSVVDKHTARVFLQQCIAKQQGFNTDTHPDRYFLAAQLAKLGMSPKVKQSPPVGLNYAYHFDSALLGQYLQKIAIKQGVDYLRGKVVAMDKHLNNDIKQVVLADGQQISGDFFVDCSGFQALLIQQLGSKFVSYDNQLFNDKAIALSTECIHPLPSQTHATALSNGWAWQIPLTTRTGNGYVYASGYCNADKAETELRRHLGMLDHANSAKHLSMKVGRLEHHWKQNCLAIGLSQGFIEPLEATALHLVQHTIDSFVSAFCAGNFTTQHQAQFNQRINNRFDGIKDYIVAHYKINSRDDSDYWRDNRTNDNISASLKSILHCWDTGGNLIDEINHQQIAGYYPIISWFCLLAGYGHFSANANVVRDDASTLANIDNMLRSLSGQFKTHQQALEF
jgi:tryptophan 6-halogenase